MMKAMQMEQYHVTVYAPRGLPEVEYDAMHRTLIDPHFRLELRRAVRRVVRRHPSLRRVKSPSPIDTTRCGRAAGSRLPCRRFRSP